MKRRSLVSGAAHHHKHADTHEHTWVLGLHWLGLSIASVYHSSELHCNVGCHSSHCFEDTVHFSPHCSAVQPVLGTLQLHCVQHDIEHHQRTHSIPSSGRSSPCCLCITPSKSYSQSLVCACRQPENPDMTAT